MNRMSSDAQIWRIGKVMEKTGLARSTIYKLIQAGTFPRPVKLTAHASGWRSDEVMNWIRSREAA